MAVYFCSFLSKSLSFLCQSSTHVFIVALEQGSGCWKILRRSAFILSWFAKGSLHARMVNSSSLVRWAKYGTVLLQMMSCLSCNNLRISWITAIALSSLLSFSMLLLKQSISFLILLCMSHSVKKQRICRKLTVFLYIQRQVEMTCVLEDLSQWYSARNNNINTKCNAYGKMLSQTVKSAEASSSYIYHLHHFQLLLYSSDSFVHSDHSFWLYWKYKQVRREQHQLIF